VDQNAEALPEASRGELVEVRQRRVGAKQGQAELGIGGAVQKK
jgi:hypothetical protein